LDSKRKLISSQKDLISTNELIFRSLDEITQFLSKVGFGVEKVYGDFGWNLANNQSSEFIFVASKD
jgi:hypothetical protein